MKIELSKIDAPWLKSGLGCYVSINNSLLDVITPLNSSHESTFVDVPESGTLRLVIRDMGKSVGNIASATIPLSALSSSTQWIDLTSGSEMTLEGKILIKVLKDSHDELFMTEAQLMPENSSEVFFASEILSSTEPCSDFLRTSRFTSEEHEKKFQEVIDLLHGEIESYKESIEMERESNKRLKDLIQGFLNSQESMEKRSKDRENALLNLLDEKELELRNMMENHRGIIGKVKGLELENQVLKSKLAKEAEERKQMQSEVENYKKSIRYFEENTERLSSALIEVSNSHLESSDKSSEWSFRAQETKVDSKVEGEHEKTKINEDILSKVKNLTGMGAKIEKVSDMVFKVNDTEVHMTSTKEGLFVRSGNQLCEIEEFFKPKHKKNSISSEVPNYPITFFDIPEIKKTPQKVSPCKLILKPSNTNEKFKATLYKPILKKN